MPVRELFSGFTSQRPGHCRRRLCSCGLKQCDRWGMARRCRHLAWPVEGRVTMGPGLGRGLRTPRRRPAPPGRLRRDGAAPHGPHRPHSRPPAASEVPWWLRGFRACLPCPRTPRAQRLRAWHKAPAHSARPRRGAPTTARHSRPAPRPDGVACGSRRRTPPQASHMSPRRRKCCRPHQCNALHRSALKLQGRQHATPPQHVHRCRIHPRHPQLARPRLHRKR